MGQEKHERWVYLDTGEVYRESLEGDGFADFDAMVASLPEPNEKVGALIAAAPDLLASLADLRRICADIPLIERNPRFAEANRAALAAIARAGGA